MKEVYTGQETDFYVTTPEVADTVNLAIALNRPILVEGEPGCGKTMLARSIAVELGLGEPQKIVVRSTSKAQDLLYRINNLRRLQDAQDVTNKEARYIYPYLSLGLLGRAIQANERRVVLIDEIDKADIDFPNDLLNVLEAFAFTIDDLPEEEEAQALAHHQFGRQVVSDEATRPIIVITSNREKRLPDPFLRRCLYILLKFPETPEQLLPIVRLNLRHEPVLQNEALVETAVTTFLNIRQTAMRQDVNKPPTTSELLDWLRILHWKAPQPADLTNDALPPYWHLLFKDMRDLETYRKTAEKRS